MKDFRTLTHDSSWYLELLDQGEHLEGLLQDVQNLRDRFEEAKNPIYLSARESMVELIATLSRTESDESKRHLIRASLVEIVRHLYQLNPKRFIEYTKIAALDALDIPYTIRRRRW